MKRRYIYGTISLIIGILIVVLTSSTNSSKGDQIKFSLRDIDSTMLKIAEANYKNYCAGCHGDQLEAFIDRKWVYGSAPDNLFKAINSGYPNLGMPSYDTTFTDDEVRMFEDEQEEKAIISYGELLEKTQEFNAAMLAEEAKKTEKLEKKKEDTINIIEGDISRFKKNDFISPVYGKQENKGSYPTVKKIDPSLETFMPGADISRIGDILGGSTVTFSGMPLYDLLDDPASRQQLEYSLNEVKAKEAANFIPAAGMTPQFEQLLNMFDQNRYRTLGIGSSPDDGTYTSF